MKSYLKFRFVHVLIQELQYVIAWPSDHILQFLYQHMNKPEFQVRFHWENNSVAIWDNRITQHYAVCDYLPELRHMQRITVVNDKRELAQK